MDSLIRGHLFSDYFLAEGVRESDSWRSLDDDDPVFHRLREIHGAFRHPDADEATTEDEIIRPVLEVLGYAFTRQKTPSGKGRTDVPDFLLFANEEKKREALSGRHDGLYRHGCAILEAKRWDRPLDRGDATDPLDRRVPANQMLRYLASVDVASNGGIRFGILTNGRIWRLYDHKAESRAEGFLEIDLHAALGFGHPDLLITDEARRHALRLFVLFFRRPSLPSPHGNDFLLHALDEGRRWETRVADSLRSVIFERVFPRLAAGFARSLGEARKENLPELYQATLILLYRLLFIFYAEDRGLLPADSDRYDDYSLLRIRREIAGRVDARDVFSERLPNYYRHLLTLFEAIGEGDDSIGIPPYNGGLFDHRQHPFLARHAVADAFLAPALDELSRVEEDGRKHWVNYRDMDVRRLGSIYEGLLEYRLGLDEAGKLVLERDTYARKVSGSYYTHDDLVHLCIRQSLKPLLDEQWRGFEEAVERLSHERSPKAARRRELERLSPSQAALSLRVCDPAMGSGHFLVAVVDWLADEILVRMDLETEAGAFCDYTPPLEARIEEIRRHVLEEAERHGWEIDASRLENRHIVKRMVLKRVIFGVDLNPMAVELAKLSLWLHSFTMGAPLSFLDHHLKCGNSLVGADPEALENALAQATLFGGRFQHIYNAAGFMEHIAELSDADIADVKESAEFYAQAQSTIAPLWRALDLYTAHDFMMPREKKAQKSWTSPRALIDGAKGDPLKVAMGEEALHPEDEELRQSALAKAARLHFFHWKLAFPEVWFEHGREREDGGFDVILGNPPWDRIKLQENEFFALRDPAIARAATAAERKRLIKRLPITNIDLYEEYQQAAEDSARLAHYARACGDYPLLSGGDPNLYALFVERSLSLLKNTGRMSLVVPSGIVADKEKARFLADALARGRVASVYDFENGHLGGTQFFPEVDRRFKFCVFTLQGGQTNAAPIRCGFFLHHVDEVNDQGRTFELSPDDLARINPNTKTLPVFRHRRDAEITRAIYERVPVLIRRDGDGNIIANPWGVRFLRMFDMTNDSHLFKTAAELEAKGFYRVRENGQPVYRKGEERYLRLYQGRMIHQFNHRFGNIRVNLENVHNPYLTKESSAEQLGSIDFTPDTAHWVPLNKVSEALLDNSKWLLGFRDIARPTDARTVIASLMPVVGVGNTTPLIISERSDLSCLLASLNSFVLDFIARQKVQGTHLNFFIIEQLPILPPEVFERELGGLKLRDWIGRQVLELTYVSEDMRPFAEAMGYAGDPFPWDEEKRRHLVARLDALFFHLYGVGREDAAYILDTFPIVRRHDEERFGRFRTREMILAYMNAVAAGDLEVILDV